MKIILDTKEDFHHLPHVVSFLSAIQDKPIPTNFSAPIQADALAAYPQERQTAAQEPSVQPESTNLFSMFGSPMDDDPDKDDDSGMEKPSLDKSIINQEPLPGMAAQEIVQEAAAEESSEPGLKKIDIIEYY